VKVVGLGTQDDLAQAEEFVATYGTTFTMLWDPTFESWANLGVALQPSVLIVAPDGLVLGRWAGMPSEDEMLSAARQSTTAADETGGTDRFCRYADRYVEAHTALVGVETVEQANRQRVFDDIRFAANAMAQTAPPSAASDVRSFADGVVALAQTAVEARFDLDVAREAGYGDDEAVVRAQAGTISAAIEAECGNPFVLPG
jgi:hypothetical protein